MNRYDKEERIISDFQDIDTSEIGFGTSNLKTISIFNSIHNKSKWKKWIDSSSKKELPPDFYNPSSKLMMDVMRIDDHTHIDENGRIINPHNKRESELVKELISKNESIKSIAEQGHLFITPHTGLSTDEDHNYIFYIDCFKRVVEKHIKKIANYKRNHPGFKIIFFVLDESSPYIKSLDKTRPRRVGERAFGELHFWWNDMNMISCLKDSEIDYLFWMTPYKHFDSKEKIELPKAIIFDVKKIKYDELICYNSSEMQSLEL